MMAEGLVTLDEVAQDGVRIRASAGASSFRGRETLETCLHAAETRVAQLAGQRDRPDPTRSARKLAAQERAAREREERVRAAANRLPELEAIKERQRKMRGKAGSRVTPARASTTDADAHVMRMGDGGYRPAYNAQLATDHDSQVILGVSVITTSADQGQALPVEDQIALRTGQHPRRYLIDGGYVDRSDITALETRGVEVYAPPPPPRAHSARQRFEPHPGDSPQVIDWRARMATDEAKAIYKDRAATAECVNAQVRARYGLHQLPVRGVSKVLMVLLLVAITHNLSRWISLTQNSGVA
jgi:hypothetical protein